MNHPLATLFEQFLKERSYLKNVTPRTIVWYQVAFKSYRASLGGDSFSTKTHLQQFVIALRQREIRPVTCNTYIGAMNVSFLKTRIESSPSVMRTRAGLHKFC